jgi:hypothetical protein
MPAAHQPIIVVAQGGALGASSDFINHFVVRYDASGVIYDPSYGKGLFGSGFFLPMSPGKTNQSPVLKLR